MWIWFVQATLCQRNAHDTHLLITLGIGVQIAQVCKRILLSYTKDYQYA